MIGSMTNVYERVSCLVLEKMPNDVPLLDLVLVKLHDVILRA